MNAPWRRKPQLKVDLSVKMAEGHVEIAVIDALKLVIITLSGTTALSDSAFDDLDEYLLSTYGYSLQVIIV